MPESGVHIWDFFQHGKYKALEGSLGEKLQEARIMDDQPILLEDKVGPWAPSSSLVSRLTSFDLGHLQAHALRRFVA